MKHTIRFIILIFALVIAGIDNVRAITENDIIINVKPNKNAGTVTVTAISDMTVTITAVPATGYTINADHILVEKMVNASAPRRAPGMASGLTVTPGDNNTYSFTIPEGYDGAYVTATFYSSAANSITSLSQINDDLAGTYVLTADVNAAGFESLGNFTGTLDGGFHKIYNLSEPLFTSTSGSAIIRNITFEDINISVDADWVTNHNAAAGDAGAVTANAGGSTRIYNCGILPSSVERDNDGNITGFSGSTVRGTGNVGGLVGTLSDNARVINCYSYATLTGGTDVGGIVGYNDGTTTAGSITTMVMNCMFYGDITGGSIVSPVYGGNIINNLKHASDRNLDGLNTFCYYAYDQLKTMAISDGKYNCALAVEEKYLTRFEIYRQLLNSNKKLAAYYATGNMNDADKMAKWVLETADRTIVNPLPYPILKPQGYYPSIINIDAENAPDSTSVGRNMGGKLGKSLTVNINLGSGYPEGAEIKSGKSQITLVRTDKDEARFNFNYDKVQLPYYNDVGTKNYTSNKVVTGWKITGITTLADDPYTSSNYDYSKTYSDNPEYFDYPNYNFADRKSSQKDLYSVSGRVFSQGAYFDVPYGVTSITIEPYWGKAAYVSDEHLDVVYSTDENYKIQNVTKLGKQFSDAKITIDGSQQDVKSSISGALGTLSGVDNPTVYDYAVVLVGNLHQNGVPSKVNKPFTMMSVDLDNDHEPDCSLIYHHNTRETLAPIRFDFLNVPGTAQAQKPNGASTILNAAIFRTLGWFEITNTAFIYFTQYEYENTGTSTEKKIDKTEAPLILLGGYIDQFVSAQSRPLLGKTTYIHVGSNVLINSFGLGTHSDGSGVTQHIPVSVTGGEYNGFYLSGTYNQDATPCDDNAECYISGGRFGELAGAAQEQIGSDNSASKGNVTWQIYNADITDFYGGGINDAKPIQGNIITNIFNSYVTTFCGGPKFGNMASNRTVTTNAEGCTFNKFFGAGYGGNSYSRKKYFDNNVGIDWNTFQGYYTTDKGKYFNGITTNSRDGGAGNAQYGKKGPGVATDFDYELFVWTSGKTGARFFVKFVSFSLAQCNNVESQLKNCHILNNFYGGGNLGNVTGTATSVLDGCTVDGSVFGAGYSADLPSIQVRDAGFTKIPNINLSSGMFEPAELSGTTEFTWKKASEASVTISNNTSGSDLTKHFVYTNVDINALGEVGMTDLTITNNTIVAGSVYGGGEESGVNGSTEVTITSGAIGSEGNGGVEYGNVYGGGKGKNNDALAGLVKGNTKVTISNGRIYHNVYGGGAYSSVGDFVYNASGVPTGLKANTTGGKTEVYITGGTFGWNGKENGMVFGSSRGDVGEPGGITDKQAWVYETDVVIGTSGSNTGPQIKGSIYGSGENGHTFNDAKVTIHSGTIGITETSVDGGARYAYRGNVYGGGCGTDTYAVDHDNDESTPKKIYFNRLAGIVQGNTTVAINGGHVVHNVYGGGAMGSVGVFTREASDDIHMPGKITGVTSGGKCTITVSGGVVGNPGASMMATGGPDDYGHVFGAGRGEVQNLADYPNLERVVYVDNTDVTISGGLVTGSVYGGSESGHVLGNTVVKIQDGQIGCGKNASGAYTDWSTASLEPTAHWSYEPNGKTYDQNADAEGKYPDGSSAEGGYPIATDGHTFFGNVFGGGSGYYPYAPGKWLRSAGHVGGTATVTISGGHILNNVYGGCEMADIENAVTVTMTGGTVGVPRTKAQIEALPTLGHIYGAGMGDKRIFFNTSTNVASTTVSVTGGTVYGSVYGGGEDGHVLGNATTTISKETGEGKVAPVIGCDGTSGYDGNVFGGGQGSVTALTAGVVGGNVTLNILDGEIKGSVYGGGRIASVGTNFAMVKIEDPNNPGQMIDNPLYGKMQDGDTHGCLTVNLKGGTIEQNVYGGCMGTSEDIALGVSKNVTVELNNGVADDAQGCAVVGSIFGCNNVNSSPEGTVSVHIHGTQHAGKSQIAAKTKGSYDVTAVYGGGNMAAYVPKDLTTGTTNVVIDGCGRTSILQVYGGGNAASTPATNVTVNGTYEIDEVFGGGNGKDKITINGVLKDNPGANVGFKDYSAVESTYPTKADRQQTAFTDAYVYGTGKASVNIYGGTVHRVFGGSNTKGNVRQTAVTMLEDASDCDFCVDEAYGGGKSAPMDAEAKLLMACIPGLNAAYGGAEAADIQGNVTLNITNGTFDRVFGGNNKSGTISGSITVNIEEVGCKPIIIGELYGGGNLAAYSIYGYHEKKDANNQVITDDSGNTVWEVNQTKVTNGPEFVSPQVNVKSFTSIGTIYGGGYGETAVMVGNPTVNVSVAEGDWKDYVGESSRYTEEGYTYNPTGYKGETLTITDDNGTHDVVVPSHDKGKIGAINNVFGGGNSAKVIGNTNVNIGTLSKVTVRSYVAKDVTVGASVANLYTRSGAGTVASPYRYTETGASDVAVEGTTYYEEKEVEKPVVGVDIRGNVYGGGNNAEVTGSTNVQIGAKKVISTTTTTTP